MALYYIGLMSGTSMDAVDAVLCEFNSTRNQYQDEQIQLVSTHAHAVPENLKYDVQKMQTAKVAVSELATLDLKIGHLFADVAVSLLKEARQNFGGKLEIKAIGSHGQTLIHSPLENYTMQIGDPNIIAAKTGLPVVADFRRKDMAFGGQGAPLAPAFHAQFMASKVSERIVLNIGGIANVTYLSTDLENHPPIGWDTGPGNCLMDLWANRKFGKKFDRNGDIGRCGTVILEGLLNRFLTDQFFGKIGPKSTGTDYFNEAWLDRHLEAEQTDSYSDVDVMATLAELTAATVVSSLKKAGILLNSKTQGSVSFVHFERNMPEIFLLKILVSSK